MDEETMRDVRIRIVEAIALLKEVDDGLRRVPEERPPETPTVPVVDAKRLDRIWKYLQAFIPKDTYAELREWAVVKFGYKYYVGTQKYPVGLRTAVCDKLNTFTDVQLAELEKILEAKE